MRTLIFTVLFILAAGVASADIQRYVKIDGGRVIIDHRGLDDSEAQGDSSTWHLITVTPTEETAARAILGDEINWNRILFVATLDNDGKLIVPSDFDTQKAAWLNGRLLSEAQTTSLDLAQRITAATAAGYTALVADLTAQKAVADARIAELTP